MSSELRGRLGHWLRVRFQLHDISVLPWSGRAVHSRPAFTNVYERVPRDRFWYRSQCYRQALEPRCIYVGDGCF